MPSWYVYILQSLSRDFTYIGSTSNLHRRLWEHNNGCVQSTKAFRPYEIIAYVAVISEHKARALEKYFKTGSGSAVLKKRILINEVPQHCAPQEKWSFVLQARLEKLKYFE